MQPQIHNIGVCDFSGLHGYSCFPSFLWAMQYKLFVFKSDLCSCMLCGCESDEPCVVLALGGCQRLPL